ncbi:hypothetical protein BCR34DRAFT_656254, partial [Clohesyomyces aquaticus]
LEPKGYEPPYHKITGVDEEEQTYESYLVSARRLSRCWARIASWRMRCWEAEKAYRITLRS